MKRKILVVDDDPLSRLMIREALEQAEYEVATAKDIKEGLGKLRSEKIDLVVLDIILPGSSGYDFLDNCKNDKATKDIPIIAFTGRDSDEDIDRLKRMGALACLVKDKTPPGHLENIIKMIFEQQSK